MRVGVSTPLTASYLSPILHDRRIHQQLEALWAANRGQKGDKADTAEALKAALDAEGEPWHVVIGPEGFVTNVRYRKERLVPPTHTDADSNTRSSSSY